MALRLGGKLVVAAFLGAVSVPAMYIGGARAQISQTAPLVTPHFLWCTDGDSDCDDVAATGLLMDGIAKTGGVLACVTIASNNIHAAPAMKALLNHAGHSSVPLGAYKGNSIAGGSSSAYTTQVAAEFISPSATRDDYPDAVPVLRQALKKAPNGKARIVIGGTCTNIAALLLSPGDAIDSRTGIELVAAKVERIDVMGGNFVSVNTVENNVWYDVAAANVVASQSPVPVYWAGWEVGNPVKTHVPSIGNVAFDPYRRAWELYAPSGDSRPSWDLMSCLSSLYDTAGVFSYSPAGNAVFSTQGYTTFTADPAGKNRYLIKTATDDAIERKCNAMIASFIQARSPAVTPVAPVNRLYEFRMDAGASATTQTIADSSGNGFNALRGATASVETTDPTWSAEGLSFAGDDFGILPYNAAHNVTSMVVCAVVKVKSQSGDHVILSRDNGGTASAFQLRTSGGILQWVGRGSLSTTLSDNTEPVPTDRYMLITAKIDGTAVRVRKNGVQAIKGTLLAAMPTTITVATYIGARQSSSISNRINGDIAYIAVYGANPDGAVPAIEQIAREAVAGRGIVV